MAPRVAVIVLNWNGIKDTLACLKSLSKVDYKNKETIVVDNGSTNNSVPELKKIKGITLICNKKNEGFAEGNNIGIRYTLKKCQYALLLNNDT